MTEPRIERIDEWARRWRQYTDAGLAAASVQAAFAVFRRDWHRAMARRAGRLALVAYAAAVLALYLESPMGSFALVSVGGLMAFRAHVHFSLAREVA